MAHHQTTEERKAATELKYLAQDRADELKKEAEKIALGLVDHAKETARQMLLNTNLDTSKIPLICHKIVAIRDDMKTMQEGMKEVREGVSSVRADIGWIKKLLLGFISGIGTVVTGVAIYLVTKELG